jgi:hypothetical protein
MTRAIVDDSCGTPFGIRAVSNYIESKITQKKSCAARQTLGLSSVQHFDLHPYAVRSPGVVRHTRHCIFVSAPDRAKGKPSETAENEQGKNYPAVRTSATFYLKLFQSSTVSGKM